ncbi:MAG: DUF4214 domain-containing protein [Pyrinomonadaceae bacterium]
MQVIYPDGGAREFRPYGHADLFSDGFFNISANGWLYNVNYLTIGEEPGCTQGQVLATVNPMIYYSTDGSYTKLVVQHTNDGDRSGRYNPWTLYFADGRRVSGGAGEPQRMYDRNGHYLDTLDISHNNHPATKISDELGRSIIIEKDSQYDPATGRATRQDYIYAQGIGGEQLRWIVRWKQIYVYKHYFTTAEGGGIGRGNSYLTQWITTPLVVERITLPEQAGGLTYHFEYNAGDYVGDTAITSYGWGELSAVTLPSGARVMYDWALDGQSATPGAAILKWKNVLNNKPTRKALTYRPEYNLAGPISNTPCDAQLENCITDTWTYSGGGTLNARISAVNGPDGGITQEVTGTDPNSPSSGRSLKTVRPDGLVVERLWRQNRSDGMAGQVINPYVKTEFTSLRDAAGNYVKTAVKDYTYDKNGNVTIIKEYDWMPYAEITRDGAGRVMGFPASAPPKRVTRHEYHFPTPDAEDTTTINSNAYYRLDSPPLRTALKSSEVSDGVRVLSRAEFTYDDAGTTGNLIEQRSWDSSRGGYSRPLSAANSISATRQYDAYGNLTFSTDARGTQIQLVYGAVYGVAGLYPTETTVALNTSLQRTMRAEYDFWTGLAIRTTGPDGVVTRVTYDALGRPLLAEAADGTPDETQTATSYSDAQRRVIVRSDLNWPGDGKLVSVQHYDQLGRLRLSRQLENAAAEDASDETKGVKVQSRHLSSGPNSYTLISHPYRAATAAAAAVEPTMGWTRTRADNSGRIVEVQTFAGAGLPAPWGTNAASAGTVTTAYDANSVTVTDQAGKTRRSVSDGFGRLVRVDEPDAGSGQLGSVFAPLQPTSYVYDTLSNLTQVQQGIQTRTFTYSSLSSLVSATNPESGTIVYTYDAGGNLLTRLDARGVTTTYTYDPLSRNTRVQYSDGTPQVVRRYDGDPVNSAPYSLGRLWQTETVSGDATTKGALVTYESYDALGRPLKQRQQFKTASGWSAAYATERRYNLAGGVKWQKYPSGHTVDYSYDTAGRIAHLSGNLGDGVPRTYSTGFAYDAAGRMTREQYGTQTPLYHKLHYNVRGQLYDVRLSSVNDEWNWNRGCLQAYYTGNYAWSPNPGPDNNGNVLRTHNYVPHDDHASSYTLRYQNYYYDALNRLKQADEYSAAGAQQWAQVYDYDRYGNREINAGQTWGVAETQFAVDRATNRLHAPAGSGQVMNYDPAGNLTFDSYTGAGGRTYDAENRIVVAADNVGYSSSYVYDADGRRVRRTAWGQEWWQVYGIDGELLAEYLAGAATFMPYKEYGYRSGQLLFTGTSGDDERLFKFLHKLYLGALGRSPNATEQQQKLAELMNAGAQGQMALLTSAQNLASALFNSAEYAGRNRTNEQYVSDLYWTYPQRAADSGGHQAWVNVVQTSGRAAARDGFAYSGEFSGLVGRIYGLHPTDEQRTYLFVAKLYLGLLGRDATSTELNDKMGRLNTAASEGRNQVVAAAQVIGREVVNSAESAGRNRTNRDYVMDLYLGLLQRSPDSGGWDAWTNAAATSGRPAVLDGFINGGEYIYLAGALYRETFWLTGDHLGTPRMVADKTGSLSGIKRHDYLPFGEEVGAGVGGRTTGQGYVADNVRQKFAGSERDGETGLDFMQARYYGSMMGRFTSPDPLLSSGEIEDPQTWNRYSYVLNNPLLYTDPLGLFVYGKNVTDGQKKQFEAALKQAQDNLKKIEAKYGKDSTQYKKAERAVNVYGEPGKENGVVVTASNKVGAGQTTLDGKTITVAFNPKQFESDGFQTLVGHEGSHGADYKDFLATGKTLTDYQVEYDGLFVQALLGEAQYAQGNFYVLSNGTKKAPPQQVELWNSGWKEVDKTRDKAINEFLAIRKKQGGLYELTPNSTKRTYFPAPSRRRRR